MAGEAQPGERPPATDEDKKLAADWLKRITAALARKSIKDAHKTFERNRKLLRGIDPNTGKKMRSNLHFANLASMRPQVYAKDPEFAVKPTKAVPEARLPAMRKFAQTSETVLTKLLVKDAKLKRRAKRLLTSAYATGVGWWMCAWQEPPRETQPLIANPIKDSTDNTDRLAALQDAQQNPPPGQDIELAAAQAKQTQVGLQAQAEVAVGRGVTLDFVLSEDVITLDASVLELGDYLRSDALALRVWMTRGQYKLAFGYDAVKARGYVEKGDGAKQAQVTSGVDPKDELLCVYQVWEQASNRVFTVCEGEEGFCKAPFSPDWTGKRWYPFFAVVFNEVDGAFYPLSDVELTEPLVREYNETRDDFVDDRRDSRPFTVVRKGGSLTPDDVERIRNRQGNDVIVVEGVGGQPIAHDIQPVALGELKPEVYNTQPARADMEMIVGGGDAARGSVMEAKTATEAKILSQGMHGRADERRDTMEDLLSELGEFVLQMALRKLTREEVAKIAGEEGAAVWPAMTNEQVFDLVTVEVRGGSTGKPDQMLEQEQWIKLLPVIEKTAAQVSELYLKGQMELAQVLIELLRETLRRFDERIDVEQFLPKAPQDGQANPAATAQELALLKQKFEECQQALKEAQDKLAKNYISAAASLATSPNPAAAVQAMPGALIAAHGGQPDTTGLPQPEDPRVAELMAQIQQLQQELQGKGAEHAQAIEKIHNDAHVAEQVGKYKAGVDGAVKVHVEKARIEADQAAQEALAGAQSEHAAALAPIADGMQALHQHLEALHGHVTAPKPNRKVVHVRDPKTQRLIESKLVDEPAHPAPPAGTGAKT